MGQGGGPAGAAGRPPRRVPPSAPAPAEAGFFTTPSQMPGAVIEPLYLTDPFEGSLAASSSGQQTIATGVARAVEQYFAPTSSTSTSSASG